VSNSVLDTLDETVALSVSEAEAASDMVPVDVDVTDFDAERGIENESVLDVDELPLVEMVRVL